MLAGPMNVTLDPLSLTAFIPISVLFDDRFEADREFFTVRIVDVVGGQIDPETSTVNVTIFDETCEYLNLNIIWYRPLKVTICTYHEHFVIAPA